MESYGWPGNVREMRNIVERIAILCDKEVIEPQHLPPEMQRTPAWPPSRDFPASGTISSASSNRLGMRPSWTWNAVS